MFFDNYVRLIDTSQVAISTSSQEYLSSQTRRQANNAYIDRKFKWNSCESFNFNVSVSLEYFEASNLASHNVKSLLTSGQSLKTFASLFDDKTFADLTLVVRYYSFKVHKCVLGASSEVFKEMLTAKPQQKSFTIDSDPVIFKHFVKFIYTNEVPVDRMPIISMDLYMLAHRYKVEHLMKICLLSIDGKKIDRTNALDLYELATTHDGTEKLLKRAWEFIKT